MTDFAGELETAAKIAREAAVLVRSYRGKRLLPLMQETGGDCVTGRLMQALPRLCAGQANQGVGATPPGVFVPAAGGAASDGHGLLQQPGCLFTLAR